MPTQIEYGRPHSTGLVEVLDRVLGKGLFVGGAIKISLAEVELLTIRIRLIVCSLDKAREMGLDWWMYDRHLAPGRAAAAEHSVLEQRVAVLEQTVGTRTATRAERTTTVRRSRRRTTSVR
jgi:Gas vesicle protein